MCVLFSFLLDLKAAKLSGIFVRVVYFPQMNFFFFVNLINKWWVSNSTILCYILLDLNSITVSELEESPEARPRFLIVKRMKGLKGKKCLVTPLIKKSNFTAPPPTSATCKHIGFNFKTEFWVNIWITKSNSDPLSVTQCYRERAKTGWTGLIDNGILYHCKAVSPRSYIIRKVCWAFKYISLSSTDHSMLTITLLSKFWLDGKLSQLSMKFFQHSEIIQIVQLVN